MRIRIRTDGLNEGWVERYMEDLRARLGRGEFGAGAQTGFGRRRFDNAQEINARGDVMPEFLSSNQDS